MIFFRIIAMGKRTNGIEEKCVVTPKILHSYNNDVKEFLPLKPFFFAIDWNYNLIIILNF